MTFKKILKDQKDKIISSSEEKYLITLNIAKENAIEVIFYLKKSNGFFGFSCVSKSFPIFSSLKS